MGRQCGRAPSQIVTKRPRAALNVQTRKMRSMDVRMTMPMKMQENLPAKDPLDIVIMQRLPHPE